jgi:TorA maturation chaperone TorD
LRLGGVTRDEGKKESQDDIAGAVLLLTNLAERQFEQNVASVPLSTTEMSEWIPISLKRCSAPSQRSTFTFAET